MRLFTASAQGAQGAHRASAGHVPVREIEVFQTLGRRRFERRVCSRRLFRVGGRSVLVAGAVLLLDQLVEAFSLVRRQLA